MCMIKGITRTDYILQLAEECSELSQACVKLIRKRAGTNWTPKTENECIANLIEEMADVKLCMEMVIGSEDIPEGLIDTTRNAKLARWKERQEEHT